MVSFWPLFDLELHTAHLVLRPARDDDFAGLLDAVDAGVHDPEVMPFSVPWTDAEPVRRRLNSVKFWWEQRARWAAEDWNVEFAVFLDGTPIGVQGLFAKQFPVLREVGTGSWLSRSYQGRGFGREMRAAVLDLAFDGLGALVARSAAFVDNPASIRVSQALGYRENGRFRQAPRGDPKEIVNFEITSEEWRSRRFSLPPVTVVGLDAVLPMFGLHEESPSAASGNVRSAGKGQIEQSACMGEGDTRDSTTKRWIDADSYARQLFEDNRAGRCFICDLIHDSSRAHLIRKDDLCIAFLPKYPTLRGRALLAPIKHRTQVVGDFSENEYLAIQRHVYRLGRAISTAFPTERLYVLSLGSNDGVAHVHWHLAPLPPGVPLAAQQFQALDIANGYLDLSENELAGIASRISRNLDGGET